LVVDSSALLAILLDEPDAEWAATQLSEHAGDLRMSTVNLAEVLIRLRDLQPHLADELEDRILTSGIRYIGPDVEQARLAAEARKRYPLNLGDCFAYALAVVEDCPVLTLDRDFRAIRHEREVLLPPG
jgi:ribonuclease VapC